MVIMYQFLYNVNVNGTNVSFKQSFFAVEGKSSQGQQPQNQTPQVIQGSTLDQIRNNLKSKTVNVLIDENSVKFSSNNNTFNVTYSPGQTQIAGMTLIWDSNQDELRRRINTNIKGQYPNLVQKSEWSGNYGGYYYSFLILKK